MVAAQHGYSKVVFYLLALQAPVDTVDRRGFTSLMYAARAAAGERAFCPTSSGMAFRNYEETVRLLLRYGASTTISNNNGDSALAIAYASGNVTLARMLEAAAPQQQKGTRVCLK